MTTATVMERLRAETASLHANAEGADFQRRMVGGELNLGDYRAWLGQMLHVHRALEMPLRSYLGEPAFAALREEQFQEPYLTADLAALGVEPASLPPLPATAAFMNEIASHAEIAPLSLLGFHYVLEGSNNGNRFIARKLVPALGLGSEGWSYLDPYGESQREKWATFKADMNAVGFTQEQGNMLVTAAKRMFQAIGEISADLNAAAARA